MEANSKFLSYVLQNLSTLSFTDAVVGAIATGIGHIDQYLLQ